MKKQLAPDHPTLIVVAEVDQHRDKAARVVDVRLTRVPDASLMDVHPHPELTRFMRNPAERRTLLVDAVFAVGDVTRRLRIDRASFARPDLRELLGAPVDEGLTVEGVVQRAPRGLLVE